MGKIHEYNTRVQNSDDGIATIAAAKKGQCPSIVMYSNGGAEDAMLFCEKVDGNINTQGRVFFCGGGDKILNIISNEDIISNEENAFHQHAVAEYSSHFKIKTDSGEETPDLLLSYKNITKEQLIENIDNLAENPSVSKDKIYAFILDENNEIIHAIDGNKNELDSNNKYMQTHKENIETVNNIEFEDKTCVSCVDSRLPRTAKYIISSIAAAFTQSYLETIKEKLQNPNGVYVQNHIGSMTEKLEGEYCGGINAAANGIDGQFLPKVAKTINPKGIKDIIELTIDSITRTYKTVISIVGENISVEKEIVSTSTDKKLWC